MLKDEEIGGIDGRISARLSCIQARYLKIVDDGCIYWVKSLNGNGQS